MGGNDSKMNGKECVCGWGVCGCGVGMIVK